MSEIRTFDFKISFNFSYATRTNTDFSYLILFLKFFGLRCRAQPVWLQTPSDQLVIFLGSGLCESEMDLLGLMGKGNEELCSNGGEILALK